MLYHRYFKITNYICVYACVMATVWINVSFYEWISVSLYEWISVSLYETMVMNWGLAKINNIHWLQ